MNKIVVALGGNALQEGNGAATADNQLKVVRKTVGYLADIVEKGYSLIVTHGNGPQVGRIVIQNENSKEITPAMPLDVCGAMSQGMIGYHMQQALGDELRKRKLNNQVATVVTQVVVDNEDEGFKNPTKPIGPFYSKEEADILMSEKGYHMVEDSGRGYRRVVASPEPKQIVEIETIKTLIENNHIVITVGGGGIPVTEDGDKLQGVTAVIDKDLASQRLAEEIDADTLVVLTAVDRVSINFGTPNQKDLNRVKADEMKKYAQEGHFAPGSMLPKVFAGIRFVESKPGRKTIITSLDKVEEAIKGTAGTIIE